MQDPRALANTNNLNSYRAWTREGYRRSGFFAIIVIEPLLMIAFTSFITLFEHPTRDLRTRAELIGAAFALYLVTCVGLMLFATLRLNAWKRAHPWAPPSPRSLWGNGPLPLG
jgi:hypothetical protein